MKKQSFKEKFIQTKEMAVTTVISSLVAVAKAIPALRSLVHEFFQAWYRLKDAKDVKKYDDIKTQASVLAKQIEKADTDEDRRALARILFRIERM